MGRPRRAGGCLEGTRLDDQRCPLRGTTLYVAYGNGELGPFDSGPDNPFGPGERVYGIESAAFVQRLGELKIRVTVYAYGPSTHTMPYFVRDLHKSFPLVLKALGL